MYAQTTFTTNPNSRGFHHTRPILRNAGSKQRFTLAWMVIYAVLSFSIVAVLGLAALILWMEQPAQVNNLLAQPAIVVTGNLPSDQPLPVQPLVVAQPVLAPVVDVTELLSPQPTIEQVLPSPSFENVSMVAQPEPEVAGPVETAQPAAQPASNSESGEPSSANSPLSLDMEDNYYWQLSVPGGQSACGPTALLMALDYYNLENSLDDVIVATSLPAEDGGYDPTCTANVVCTSPQVLAKVAAETYGLNVDAREGWTFEEIYVAVSEGSPVIADIVWDAQEGDRGHFVVIYGIDPVNKVIVYHDPYRGAGVSTTWDNFQVQWSAPVDSGDPVQVGGYRSWGMAIYMR